MEKYYILKDKTFFFTLTMRNFQGFIFIAYIVQMNSDWIPNRMYI